MENKEILEQVETAEVIEQAESEVKDPRKSKFVVHTYRDVKMMMAFLKLDTRVRHPKAQFNMIILGIGLYVFAFRIEGMKMPGIIASCFVGTLLIALAVFRHSMSLASLRKNPQVKENEELYYYFGKTGIRCTADGVEQFIGHYKEVYRVWEDEYNFFLGLDNEDLVVLPKCDFETGDFTEFIDFILEKTGADYRWSPSKLITRTRNAITNFGRKMATVDYSRLKKDED